jgi:hypothetical protein
MATRIEFDCSTGIETVREETAEEAAQRIADAEEAEARREADEAAEAEHTAARESGTEKLKSLGLSDEEIAALIT